MFVRHHFTRRLATFGSAVLSCLLLSVTTYAQGGFVSGSTGADGAFNPTESQTVQLPESGVFNFTTINIPANVTIRFARNSRNTPVTILATGNITIAGTIDVSGSPGTSVLGGAGGPGGFNGGAGGPTAVNGPSSPGVTGDGPGGGAGGRGSSEPNIFGTGGGGGFGVPGSPGGSADSRVTNGAGGPKYGLPTLLPLIGGSGGGGETGHGSAGAGGGGGGGALLIATSGTIGFGSTGFIHIAARGGNGQINSSFGSGGGSGGAIRLMANGISGDFRVDGGGGFGASNGGHGGGGYVRIEAFNLNSFNIQPINTGASLPRITTATPGVVTPTNQPSIRIVSVAGIAPPNQPNGSLQGGPDIILPANQANPVNVSLAASNIPLGTTLQVTLTPENGPRVVTQSTALTGTLSSSTATASITLPDGISVIQASGTIDVAALAMVIDGERIKTIEVATVFGGKQTVTYITASNRRIKAEQ
jgi:hypothetical protein